MKDKEKLWIKALRQTREEEIRRYEKLEEKSEWRPSASFEENVAEKIRIKNKTNRPTIQWMRRFGGIAAMILIIIVAGKQLGEQTSNQVKDEVESTQSVALDRDFESAKDQTTMSIQEKRANEELQAAELPLEMEINHEEGRLIVLTIHNRSDVDYVIEPTFRLYRLEEDLLVDVFLRNDEEIEIQIPKGHNIDIEIDIIRRNEEPLAPGDYLLTKTIDQTTYSLPFTVE